jgi:hypothetical protein
MSLHSPNSESLVSRKDSTEQHHYLECIIPGQRKSTLGKHKEEVDVSISNDGQRCVAQVLIVLALI